MREADVAIIGGGLAGSTAAAMLGRAGICTVLADPHPSYPNDFRCEKLDASQVALLRKTGVAETVLQAATPDQRIWVARFGRVVEKKPSAQYNLMYPDMVNAMRSGIARPAEFVCAKATGITTGGERQRLTLSTGEEISARLVVLANGLNISLRGNIGIAREVISPCHSISIGFDIAPVGRSGFDFPGLTYYSERAADRIAYVTLFPIGSRMRANLFVYRDMHDPWLREMRRQPEQTLFAAMPGLRALTGQAEITGVIIRPVDLYVSSGHRQAGIVLVGDAFATSCPAAGTGCNKVFTDVERLCNVHIPRWLATCGMSAEKIAAFYEDPVKAACDSYCADKAFYLRSFSINRAAVWQARRLAKFAAQLGRGRLRRMRDLLARAAEPRRAVRSAG